MNTFKKIRYLSVLLLGLVSCNNYLDKQPMSDYLSNNFYNNEGSISEGANGVYQSLYMESSQLPFCTLYDMYTPMGIERADNSSIGVNNVNLLSNYSVELQWANFYAGVARCNTVLDGAAPYIASLNDKAKQYLAEIKVIRAFHYSYLISLWGDVPFFTSLLTPEQQKTAMRTPWMNIVDQLIKDLDEASTHLPWKAAEMGRVDRSFALGLKARIALYAASWCKFGYGEKGDTNPQKAQEYFQIAADAANKVILESGRRLSSNYAALFTKVGQMTAEAKNENIFYLMYSDQSTKRLHYQSFGEQSRMFAQSGRFPTGLLIDSYEMSNGKRIDEPGSGYDPKDPFAHRDYRLKQTVYTQHDTIIGNSGGNKLKFLMELYSSKTKSFDTQGNATEVTNLDYTGSVAQYGYVQSGVGYLWKKYNHFDDEAVSDASYNVLLMRYAEVLLTYAEAKIELNQIDESVYSAINQVRARVGMPDILSVDPSRVGNQEKMRQIVRRERRVELMREAGLHFFDMRRWRIADLENTEPTYGFPKDGYSSCTADMVPSYGSPGSRRDLNDLALYGAFASKLRTRDADRGKNWKNRYYLWPIPQVEINKAPQLIQNDGY